MFRPAVRCNAVRCRIWHAADERNQMQCTDGEFRGCENVCMLMQLKQDDGKCDAIPCKLGY